MRTGAFFGRAECALLPTSQGHLMGGCILRKGYAVMPPIRTSENEAARLRGLNHS
ncbi:hypothetical protein BJX62DRAFT_194939 [Aspergillus germanicus]